MVMLLLLMVVVVAFVVLRDRIPMVGRAAVALVKVEGLITDTSEEIRLLRKYGSNPLVRAIVVRVESPGGTVGGSQELYREIRKTREKSGKPIIASLGNVAASGGYYVACAADEIYANPGTVTGSIGVIFQTYDLQGLSKKIGVGVNTIKSGKFKDTGSFFREMTEEEKQIIQGTIDDTYEQFLEAVIEARRSKLAQAYLDRNAKATTPSLAADSTASSPTAAGAKPADTDQVAREVVEAHLRSIADGRVLSGRQAREWGLLDHLGGLQDAIDRAAKLARVRGRPVVIQERRKRTFWDLVQSRTDAVSRLARHDGVALEYRLCFD
ncbi:hypothetical protein AMJ85_02865 [candidate division BRC1 bacterium SM23_51]|nr:MAG: hypothetical protein AMJ85_02865 [candidate division BRC1 bacterium SM23_51]